MVISVAALRTFVAVAEAGNIVEAAVDAFELIEGNPTGIDEQLAALVKTEVFPNPFTGETTFAYELPSELKEVRLLLRDALGRILEEHMLSTGGGSLQLGAGLPGGFYFLELRSEGSILQTQKLIKSE